MTQISTIERIQKHARRIKNGEHDKIGPGKPLTMSNALTVNEFVAQGDLNLVVLDKVPSGYVKYNPKISKIKNPCKLVMGDTQGSKHELRSLEGVTMYHHPDWNFESLEGPVLLVADNATAEVLHPTHGHINVMGGLLVHCRYQKERSKELEKERRARD